MFEIKFDTLRNRLISLRTINQITQLEMATFCNISISAYKSYEKEMTSIPHPVLIKMEEIFKVSIDFLLLGGEKNIPKEKSMNQIKKATKTTMKIEEGKLHITNHIPLYDYLG